MRTVRINKGELIEALTANRKTHKLEYEVSIRGWKEECIGKLEQLLQHIKDGALPDASIHIPQPDDHTKDYDLALKMLNMSVDNVVELTSEQFNQFINDDWEWKARWSASNMKYLGK